LVENASFNVLTDKIVQPFYCRRRQEKGEGKVSQRHKTLYFSYLWGGHPWADSHKIWRACCTSWRNQNF